MHTQGLLFALLGSTVLASTAAAQTTLNYWDFSSLNDSVGGVVGSATGTPDLSIHPTYGEAYPGSGASLNTILGALGSGVGGGVIDADVFDTAPTAMNFGTASFSFTYWVFDDFAGDGDVRGPRPFDCLAASLTEGLQFATNTAGVLNLRLDDDAGNSVLSNSTITLTYPQNTWTHMAFNVDRVAQTVTIYVDGVNSASYSIAALTGGIAPSQDLRIGGINFADNAGGAQNQGLDDLAFYDDLLSQSQISGLAAATLTPLDFGGGISSFCDPADNNSTGFPTVMSGNFGTGVGSGLHLEATQGPPTQFGYFLIGTGVSDPGTPISDGHLCLSVTGGNTFGRYNVSGGALNSIGQFDAGGVLQNMVGTSTVGSGFDVPTTVPSIGGTITAGSTWHFQLWHREDAGASNFSNGLTVNF